MRRVDSYPAGAVSGELLVNLLVVKASLDRDGGRAAAAHILGWVFGYNVYVV